MVTTARSRPDDLMLPKGNAPLVTAPPGALYAVTSVPIRSAERRRWAADLTGPDLAGLVLHGAGGIGKSTLASQIVSRISHLEPEWVTVVVRGQVSADTVLGGVAETLRRHPVAAQGDGQAQSLRAADRTDLPWAHRLALLRELVLGQVPVLLVLDDFDDNVSPVSGGWTVRDPALAELITSWGSTSHRGRLLITCRHPFRPPGDRRAAAHIPPCRPAVPFQRFRAGEITARPRIARRTRARPGLAAAGRPSPGHGIPGLAARHGSRPVPGGSPPSRGRGRGQERQPGPARRASRAHGAAAGRCGVGGPGRPRPPAPRARRLLLGRAAPAGRGPAAPPGGRPLPRALRPHARHAAGGTEADRTGACRAGSGRARGGRTRGGRTGGGRTRAGRGGRGFRPGAPRVVRGARGRAEDAPERQQAVLQQASAIRSRAAAWVARQVSQDAIVACDPDMCSALLAQQIAPGNLLELRDGTADPLGSDVLVATAAVRSQFGARLASVYAPAVLASFGSGRLRIDVRAVAPDGAAAYRAQLAADLTARRKAGGQLLGNPHIQVSAAARKELQAGQVDSPAARHPGRPGRGGTGSGRRVRGLRARGERGRPAALRGDHRGRPRRPGRRGGHAHLRRPQPAPYLPARSLIEPGPAGASVLSIQFAAPSPVGLLQPETTP